MLWKFQNLTQGSENSSRGKVEKYIATSRIKTTTTQAPARPTVRCSPTTTQSRHDGLQPRYPSHSPDLSWLFMVPLRLFNTVLSGSFTEVIMFGSHEMEFFVEIIFSCKYHYLCHKFVHKIWRLKLLGRQVFAVFAHDKVH